MARVRWFSLSQCLILLRARELLVKLSQSREGEWPAWVVTYTMSPLRSLWRSGTMRLFTFAPIVAWPTSVWMA